MPGPISAVESISPAFADTRRMLFAPWKFGMWWRMSILGLLTGEFAGGGFSASPPNFQLPQQNRQLHFALVPPDSGFPPWVRENWMWLALCGILLIALFFIAEYLASVSRFVLFDSVVIRHCDLRKGWKKWRAQGVRYFFWDIGFAFVCLVALVLLIGIPLWSFVKHIPAGSKPNIGEILAAGALVIFAVVVFLIVVGVIDLFARDFLIPVMAMENCGVWKGWRRLGQLLGAQKLSCVGYVLMKIVLAIGSAILFGIVDLFVMLFLLIPLGIIAVAIYLVVRNMNLVWSFGTISAVVLAIALAVAVLFWACAFVYSPGLVFFQSYTLRFFASRYPALDAAMNPPAPLIPPGSVPEPQIPFSPAS
jgi:hypothetical protein